MASANVPESIFRWSIRRAFVHEGRNSVRHDAVDDVRMPGDPTAIGGAPVHLVGVGTKIERVFRGVGGPDHVPGGGVQNPLGLSRRA